MERVVLVATFALASARVARASDTPCPTTTDADNENLFLYGFVWGSIKHGMHVYVGNTPFYGSTLVVAGVVPEDSTERQTVGVHVYAITDHANNLLAWLPKFNNHLCLRTANSNPSYIDLDVCNANNVQSCTGATGTQFQELAYGGNRLVLYLGDGADHVHGGTGVDIIYGAAGNDDLDDGGDSPYNNVDGNVLGEDGNDFCYGTAADITLLSGGDGNDQMIDTGGVGDRLDGGPGNECCMADIGHSFSYFDCGPGTDHTDSLAGTTNCEVTDSACTQPYQFCAFAP